jgi:hypothetical protein
VRQRRTDLPAGIRFGLVWATLAYLCLSVALIFFLPDRRVPRITIQAAE